MGVISNIFFEQLSVYLDTDSNTRWDRIHHDQLLEVTVKRPKYGSLKCHLCHSCKYKDK
ncbi:hypothetical protein DPMN_126579 [Dreissena polymorpha]|uniref:Uncharacterized protein n=1 Tax=Dreissena polymorpha TaxID=45954 RepID=A0A9D4GZL4_DREPO|nr:hypothetical protein DPMN_126566 [Dreissena polymorpha]KAH3824726.1 hypothetical protein DPMN_126579 [Dreissena polymorpha]